MYRFRYDIYDVKLKLLSYYHIDFIKNIWGMKRQRHQVDSFDLLSSLTL
jgi:hypothetical protein